MKRRRRWEDDDSTEPEDDELIEAYYREQTADSWIDLNGESVLASRSRQAAIKGWNGTISSANSYWDFSR